MKRLLSVFSHPIQGLRLADTVPWLVIFFSVSRYFKKKEAYIFYIFLLSILYAIVISNNIEATLRIILGLVIFLIYPIYSKKFTFLKVKNLNLILINVIIFLSLEKILLSFGYLSPFVRDPDGALFIFREKSYLAFFIAFLFTLNNNRINYSELFLYLIISLIINSGLCYLFFLSFCYSKFFTNNKVFKFLPLVVILCFYFVVFLNRDIIQFLSYSDSLRFLINLGSFNGHANGTIFLHDIDLSFNGLNLDSGYFSEWKKITAQSVFFNNVTYFGYFGAVLSLLQMVILFKSPYAHTQRSLFFYIFIFISFFIQGFLFNPYFIYFMTGRKN